MSSQSFINLIRSFIVSVFCKSEFLCQANFKMFRVKHSSEEEITLKSFATGIGHKVELDELMTLLYDELHRQAHRFLRGERTDHTLQTTALINETYLRLVAQKGVQWENRAQFFGLAANMMRRILVDYAKTKHRDKRGGDVPPLPLEAAWSIEEVAVGETTKIDLIALDSALDQLAAIDLQQAKVVELRYFSGLTVEETAEVLGISPATVKRDWNVAKAWLYKAIQS
jgi:RNA polymerase sigma factor (TIGR02999 family)